MNYNIVAPHNGELGFLLDAKNTKAFDDEVILFADKLSNSILLNKQYRSFPELMAVAFWLRKSNIHHLKSLYEQYCVNSYRLARGVVFHIAPSNVDMMFIYSWFLSMFMGNRNIVRISSKLNPQVQIMLDLINRVLSEDAFATIKNRMLIVSYAHDEQITAHFSSIADVRIIWGGDETISAIRKISLPPRAIEITFANKFSFSVINAAYWLSLTHSEADLQIKQFYNDAYWFGQMACSSPRMVVWQAEDRTLIEKARKDFWQRLQGCIEHEKPELAMADSVNKLVAVQSAAIEMNVRIMSGKDNVTTRAWLEDLKLLPEQFHCGAGLFFEAGIKALPELLPVLSRKVQTVSVLGLSPDELKDFIETYQPQGIDRFVVFGQALAFSPIWDGYNLFNQLTREVVIL